MKKDDGNIELEVYVTKYALTKGIFKIKVGWSYEFKDIAGWYHGEGKEWHRTRESALAMAINMRKKKILSLKKQLKKLENMTFEIKEDE